MTMVSVTRARIRRIWDVPAFAMAALPPFDQARRSAGFLGGSVCPGPRFAFWTLTVWEAGAAMRAYMLTGAHRAAMPKFATWCDVASIVHWEKSDAAVPSCPIAAERMRREGRPSTIRRPSANHGTLTFPDPRFDAAAPIVPAPG